MYTIVRTSVILIALFFAFAVAQNPAHDSDTSVNCVSVHKAGTKTGESASACFAQYNAGGGTWTSPVPSTFTQTRFVTTQTARVLVPILSILAVLIFLTILAGIVLRKRIQAREERIRVASWFSQRLGVRNETLANAAAASRASVATVESKHPSVVIQMKTDVVQSAV